VNLELTAEEKKAIEYLELMASGHEMIANTDQDLDEEQVRTKIDIAIGLKDAAEGIRRGEHRNV
jgi:hypothetical protein